MNFCLGTVQFGTQYGVQGNARPDFSAVERMLHMAVDGGITLFDTAAAYGDAEEVLGRFAAGHPHDSKKMRFVSKLAPNALESADASDWASAVLSCAGESLKRLGAEKLYAYLFHNAQYIFREDAVQAILSVKREGLSEKAGVSAYSPQEALKALEYPEIDAVQIPYNVFDQRLDKAGFFEKARANGVTVFARSSLLQGLAVMEPDRLPEHMRFAKPYLDAFRSICEAYEVSPLQAAIGYVGQHPAIDYVVFGVDNERQLGEYLALRDVKLPSELYEELRAAFSQAEEKLVNPTLWK